MSTLIEKLHDDHKNIARLLHLLEEQISQLEAGEYTDFPLISNIMHYFANYPDIHHHPYEDFIFDVLKTKDKSTAESINSIHDEHKKMAETSAKLFDQVTQLQGNAVFPRDELVQDFKDYIANYYAHMNKEEDDLLPRADSTLNEEDWTNISSELDMDDDPVFGNIVDKQYAGLYKAILAAAS